MDHWGYNVRKSWVLMPNCTCIESNDLWSLHPTIDWIFEGSNPSKMPWKNERESWIWTVSLLTRLIIFFTSFYPCPNQCWSNSDVALVRVEIFQMHTFYPRHYLKSIHGILANTPSLRLTMIFNYVFFFLAKFNVNCFLFSIVIHLPRAFLLLPSK